MPIFDRILSVTIHTLDWDCKGPPMLLQPDFYGGLLLPIVAHILLKSHIVWLPIRLAALNHLDTGGGFTVFAQSMTSAVVFKALAYIAFKMLHQTTPYFFFHFYLVHFLYLHPNRPKVFHFLKKSANTLFANPTTAFMSTELYSRWNCKHKKLIINNLLFINWNNIDSFFHRKNSCLAQQ